MKLFRKKQKDSTVARLDPTQIQPQNAAEFVTRGYAFHARGDHQKAEEDIRHALSLESDSVEAYYALGLVLKAQGKNELAIKAFKDALARLDTKNSADPAGALMLSRLVKGHINQLVKGDWDLEKDIWKRK